MSDNKELVFDILDLTVDSCYLDILEHFASELLEYVLEYFYVLELLVVYSLIIDKTHRWAIIGAVVHGDKDFWRSEAINLGYFIFHGH